jgi:predicted polyphosphate/ATP-dependent NAD kinase
MIKIDAQGEPDGGQNPNRRLVGLTDDGAVCTVGKETAGELFDEISEEQNITITKTSMNIKVSAAQVLDADNLAQATNGIGTAVSIGTTPVVPVFTIGTGVLSYTGVAAIAPTLNDPTKFIVFHIYKGVNIAPFDLELARSKRAKLALDFQGNGIATRVKTDTLGMLIPSTGIG